MADTQIEILEGTLPKTFYTVVEKGELEDGTKYEKRQAVAPRSLTSEIADSKGKNLETRLDEMQEQLDGATTDITQAVNDIVTARAGEDIATKEEIEALKSGVVDADTLDGYHAGELPFLPLTGGTPLTGDLNFTYNEATTCTLRAGDGTANLLARKTDGSLSRALIISCEENFSDCLKIGSTRVLHELNSKPVAIAGTAPTDTAYLWYDTGTNKVKAYIDGAWQ